MRCVWRVGREWGISGWWCPCLARVGSRRASPQKTSALPSPISMLGTAHTCLVGAAAARTNNTHKWTCPSFTATLSLSLSLFHSLNLSFHFSLSLQKDSPGLLQSALSSSPHLHGLLGKLQDEEVREGKKKKGGSVTKGKKTT